MKKIFSKNERLRSKKDINDLIKSGVSFKSPPFLIIWKRTERNSKFPVKIAVSVPKKIFNRAVDRNRIKRRTLEAFRLNKHCLVNHLEKKKIDINLLVLYKKRDVTKYHIIEKGISSAIQYFIENI